jgi:hypothetical protein
MQAKNRKLLVILPKDEGTITESSDKQEKYHLGLSFRDVDAPHDNMQEQAKSKKQ